MPECPDPSVLDSVALGRATEEARAETWRHAETCEGCSALLDQLMRLYGSERPSGVERGADEDALATTVASSLPARPRSAAEGRRIGRYRVLEKLGEGAMGEVFAAYDPELDRRIALKVLLADPLVDREAQAARLAREAQAMAKLAHPNVVTVFDAGVDVESGQLFVAMELVVGTNLRAWLASDERSLGEIVLAFTQAARGLAAAHEAGLVHRDFKPDNVLVGEDGRVRVGDFGLARARIGEAASGECPSGASLDLTEAGAVVGTPAYMAPEQLRGEAVDARTDQFAFAVALHEAVFGVRPFEGQRLAELREAVLAGRRRAIDGAKPRWLRGVLDRALATRPSDRYPSMRALVHELERDRGRTARAAKRAALGLAGLAVVLGVAALVASKSGYVIGRSAPSCRDARRRVDAAYTSPKAGDTAASREKKRLFDDYADQLELGLVAACEASSLTPSPRDTRRAECLDDRLRALASAAKHADAPGNVALPSIALCADAEVLESDVEAPPSEAARDEAKRIAGELAEADAEATETQLGPVSDRLERALTDARKLAYDPTIAEALVRVARLRRRTFRFREAEKALEEAVERARASKDDAVLLDATLDLATIVGVDLGRTGDAETWLGFARAESRRRPADREAAAKLASIAGRVARRAGNLADARAALSGALAKWEEIEGSSGEHVAEALRELSSLHVEQGDAAAAKALAARALEILHGNVLLDGGPEAAPYHLAIGEALLSSGAPKDAEAAFAEARSIAIAFGGSTSNAALLASDGVARALVANGDLDGARLAAADALAGLLGEDGARLRFYDPRGAGRSSGAIDFAAKVRSRVDRPDDALSIAESNAKAAMLAVEGDEVGARAEIARAVAASDQNPRVEGSSRGALLFDEALLSLRAGDLSAASKSIELAEEALDREVGARHVRAAAAAVLRARILVKLGSPGAREPAARAVPLLEARLGPEDPRTRAARDLAASK